MYLEFLQKQAYKKKNVWVAGIMIDLNGFKQINDNYGHAEGDDALIIAAELLRKSFGEYGVVTRYAGDDCECLFQCDRSSRWTCTER